MAEPVMSEDERAGRLALLARLAGQYPEIADALARLGYEMEQEG